MIVRVCLCDCALHVCIDVSLWAGLSACICPFSCEFVCDCQVLCLYMSVWICLCVLLSVCLYSCLYVSVCVWIPGARTRWVGTAVDVCGWGTGGRTDSGSCVPFSVSAVPEASASCKMRDSTMDQAVGLSPTCCIGWMEKWVGHTMTTCTKYPWSPQDTGRPNKHHTESANDISYSMWSTSAIYLFLILSFHCLK